MSLFIILTVIQALVAAALVGVVLMQRSEGGGLGIGGNPGGALGARGAADFLTRSTRWLAIAFVGLSILLAAMAASESSVDEITTTMDRDVTAPAADDLLSESTDGGAASAEDLLGSAPNDGAGSEEGEADPLAE
ncbi:MAG: preprotein translocase subunit SecG [Pseudomonadota bacterium]